MEAKDYVAGLTDEQLLKEAEQAFKDLKDAADNFPETKHHEECFAGFFCLAQEAARRGLGSITIH